MARLVDINGLSRFLTKVRQLINGKASKDLSDVENSDFAAKVTESQEDTIFTATSTDGVDYTATIPGITALKAGLKITVKLSRSTNSTAPYLNLNGLGRKGIRQPLTTNNIATAPGPNATWINASCPVTLTYTGALWKVDFPRSSGAYLYGTVPVTGGGTGATTAADALTNLGAASLAYVQSEIARLEALITSSNNE